MIVRAFLLASALAAQAAAAATVAELVERGRWEALAAALRESLQRAEGLQTSSWRELKAANEAAAEALAAAELYDEAFDRLEVALAACRAASRQERSVELSQAISELEFRLGRPEKALPLAREILSAPSADAASRRWAVRQVARCLEKLGLWTELGDLPAALRLAGLEEILSSEDRAFVAVKRADALWALRRFAEAAEAYREAAKALSGIDRQESCYRLVERRANVASVLAESWPIVKRDSGAATPYRLRFVIADRASHLVCEVPMSADLVSAHQAMRPFYEYLERVARTKAESSAEAARPQGLLLGIRMGIPAGDETAPVPPEAAGVRVDEVVPGSPAEAAGLRAGDVIVSMNGESLGPLGPYRVREIVRRAGPGGSVRIAYRRGQECREVEAVLASAGGK